MNTEELAQEWERAKEIEAQATEARRAVEEKLIEALGVPGEGKQSKTHKLDGYVVTIKAGENIRADMEQLRELTPASLFGEITKTVVNPTALRKLRTETPSAYKKIAKALTVTPSRISATVKPVE